MCIHEVRAAVVAFTQSVSMRGAIWVDYGVRSGYASTRTFAQLVHVPVMLEKVVDPAIMHNTYAHRRRCWYPSLTYA